MFNLLSTVFWIALGLLVFLFLFPLLILITITFAAAVLVSVYVFMLMFVWFPAIVCSTWTKSGKKQATTPESPKKETP